MDEKLEKETLFGTSESTGTPFTHNFPSFNSRIFTKPLLLTTVKMGLTGFGGAMCFFFFFSNFV